MKHFFIIFLLTFCSFNCMEDKKESNKEDNNNTEKKVVVVALPHAGQNYYYDWPGAVPIAYTLVLHEREKRLKRKIDGILPYIPHFP